MTRLATIVTTGLVLALATLATAADKAEGQPAKKPALVGTVVSASSTTVVVKPESGDNVNVTVNAQTKVKIDGKDATLADLKPGMWVAVPEINGPARRINAKSVRPA